MQIDYESIRKRYFDNGGYTEAPEIITDETKRLIKCMYEMIVKNDYLGMEDGSFIKTSDGMHGLQISELLLLHLRDHYSEVLQKNLIPAYSYTRTYFKGSDLPRHSDRPSCQYSITLNIGSSSPESWPFWCKSNILNNAKDTEIHNEMYVPIIYMGEKVDHWREKLKKKHSTHIFMHYVDGDDPNYKKWWYDGRKFVGVKE